MCKANFDILNHIGVTHDCVTDGRTDRFYYSECRASLRDTANKVGLPQNPQNAKLIFVVFCVENDTF